MRPPDLPGGNGSGCRAQHIHICASMRPPDLPGGNLYNKIRESFTIKSCFNEAAGFTRRKHRRGAPPPSPAIWCFNEAAGFTRRKPV